MNVIYYMKNHSKYDENYSTVELNENIGLMPLIAPYIEEFQKVIDEREINLQLLQTEIDRLRAKTNKIIIYTEGKTDVKYLKLAFEKNDEYSEVYQRVEFYDIEHAAKTGDGELKKLYDYLQKGSDQVSDELQVVFHRFQQGIGHNGKSCGKYASPQDPGHVHGAQAVK